MTRLVVAAGAVAAWLALFAGAAAAGPGRATANPAAAEPVAPAAWFDAARDGDLAQLRKLAGPRPAALVDRANADGYTALILASYHDRRDTVAWLLRVHASTCLTDARGYTALMGAVFRGHTAIVEALARRPCGADFVTTAGQTPLMLAALFGRTDIARSLLAAGADPRRRDAMSHDARSLAAGQGNDALVALLDEAVRARR